MTNSLLFSEQVISDQSATINPHQPRDTVPDKKCVVQTVLWLIISVPRTLKTFKLFLTDFIDFVFNLLDSEYFRNIEL